MSFGWGGWFFIIALAALLSKKDGIAAYVIAWGALFLAAAVFAALFLYGSRKRFSVKWATITCRHVFAKPRTFYLSEITLITVSRHSARRYRFYTGEKRAFTIPSGMINAGVFVDQLRENHVELKYTGL